MVSRIELLLLLFILFFATQSFYIESIDNSTKNKTEQKELELTCVHMREVNQSNLQSLIYADRITKYADKLEFENFKFTSREISIQTNKASQKNRIIKLEQNSTIIKPNGTRYYASDLRYDRDSKVLDLIGEFSLEDEFGSISGSGMKYDANEKNVKGERVRATYSVE